MREYRVRLKTTTPEHQLDRLDTNFAHEIQLQYGQLAEVEVKKGRKFVPVKPKERGK